MDEYEDDVNDSGAGNDSGANGSGGAGASGVDASGKRRRVQRACDSCRKKKVKCDGGSKDNPCALCRNNGTECTFQEVAKKRGPPKGYVEQLERRLETMEKLLRTLAPEADLRHVTFPPTKSSVLTEGALLSQTMAGTFPKSRQTSAALSTPTAVSFSHRAESSSHSSATEPRQDGDSPSSTESGVVEDAPWDVAALAASVAQLDIDGRYLGNSSSLDLARTVAVFRSAMSPIPSKDVTTSSTWDEIKLSPDAVSVKNRSKCLSEELLEREEVKPENLRLPDDNLALELIDAYFEHFNPLQPILHRPSFMRRYENGDYRTDALFCGLCLAVFGVASRVLRDPRVFPDQDNVGNPTKETLGHTAGINYIIDSGKCMSNYMRVPTTMDLQILILGVMWHVGAANISGAWTVLGYGLRRALDIGMHRRNHRRHNASLLDDEMRKRSWFALEWWESYLSISLGRPLSIGDEDVDLDLPLELSDEDLDALSASKQWIPPFDAASRPPPPNSSEPTAVAGMNVNHKLKVIGSKILRSIYNPPRRKPGRDHTEADQWEQKTVAELDSALNKWLDAVPPHLRWSPTLEKKWIPISGAIYQSYYAYQILVHRVFLAPERRGVTNFPSLAICTNAARSASHVLETLHLRGCLQDTYYISCLTAITAGMVLLIGVYGSGRKIGDLSPAALDDVNKCIRVLEELKKTMYSAVHCWAGMLHMSDILTLDRSAKEAAASASASSSPVSTAQGLKRRTRPDEEEGATLVVASSTSDSQSQPTLSPSFPTAPIDAAAIPKTTKSRSRASAGGRANARTRPSTSTSSSTSQISSITHPEINPDIMFDLPLHTTELSASTFGGDATFGTGFFEGNSFLGLGQNFGVPPASQGISGLSTHSQAGRMNGIDFGDRMPSFDPAVFAPFAFAGFSPQPDQRQLNPGDEMNLDAGTGTPQANWNPGPGYANPQWDDWLFGTRPSGSPPLHGQSM